jgi:hypothetical protein
MRVPREKCVEWHVRLRADITCDHTVGTVDVVVGEVTAEGDGSVLGSAASSARRSLEVPPVRSAAQTRAFGRSKIVVEIVDLRSVTLVL